MASLLEFEPDFRTPCRSAPAHVARCGFTLIELVLVLAIVIVIIGMSWPILEKPMAYERLRHAADLVMAEWNYARIEAMRTGDHQTFTYAQETNEYRLSYQTQSDALTLPDEVIFVGGVKSEDAREVLEGGDSGSTEIWFYADGTCSDVPELLLRNRYGMQIRITLRGLSGVMFLDENVPDVEDETLRGPLR